MSRILVLAFVCAISLILADAALKTALALPPLVRQAEAWRVTQ